MARAHSDGPGGGPMVKVPSGRPGNRSPGRRPGAAAWPGRPSRPLRHWPSASLRVATGPGPSGRARTPTSRAAAARRPGITMIALGSFWGAGDARSGGLRVCCQNQLLCCAVVRSAAGSQLFYGNLSSFMKYTSKCVVGSLHLKHPLTPHFRLQAPHAWEV
jgi:hypothetical protein